MNYNRNFVQYKEYVEPPQRVREGALWLDLMYPGWAFDISTPNIESKTGCILCRLTKIYDWKTAVQSLNLTGLMAAMMGFDVLRAYEPDVGELLVCDYAELETLWLKEIEARTNEIQSEPFEQEHYNAYYTWSYMPPSFSALAR